MAMARHGMADSPDPVVRDAVGADIGAVAAIDARITGIAKPAYWRDMFERFGQRPGRYFLVADDRSGRLLGYILGEVRAWEFGSPPSGWIFALGVDPDHRLRKVGSGMFAAMCACLADAGVDTVRTMLARDDGLNMAFFRSQGMMGGPFLQLEMPLAAAHGGAAESDAEG